MGEAAGGRGSQSCRGFKKGGRVSRSSQEEWGLQKDGNSADGEGEGCFRPGGPYGLYIKRRLTDPRREGSLPSAGGIGLERQDVGQMAESMRADSIQ